MIYVTGSQNHVVTNIVLASYQRLASNIQLESDPSVVESAVSMGSLHDPEEPITQQSSKEHLKTCIDFGVFLQKFHTLYVNKIPL